MSSIVMKFLGYTLAAFLIMEFLGPPLLGWDKAIGYNITAAVIFSLGFVIFQRKSNSDGDSKE